MDLVLGTAAATLFLLSLFCAAIIDVKRGEVPNRIWIPAICAFPLALYRISAAGLLLLYTLQGTFTLVLMLICFHLGLLGGADGKAVLLMSMTYPWLEIDFLLLSIGPAVACLGAFVIGGLESVGLALLNLYEWYRASLRRRQMLRPPKRRFWLTRRLSRIADSEKAASWRNVATPLVLYVLVAYLLMLVCNKWI